MNKTEWFKAAELGDLEKVQQLLRKDHEVNVKDEKGENALFKGVQSGNWDVVEALIDAGIEKECTNQRGQTALGLAIDLGYVRVAQCLIEKGAALDNVNHGESALVQAVKMALEEIVEDLIHHGSSVHEQDQNQVSVLMWALYNDQVNVVDRLLEENVNLNHEDRKGNTALHWAVNYSSLRTVQKLMEAGANVKKRNRKGQTPREKCMSSEDSEINRNILELLKSKEEEALLKQGIKKEGSLPMEKPMKVHRI